LACFADVIKAVFPSFPRLIGQFEVFAKATFKCAAAI
jgi:hypothetical protein